MPNPLREKNDKVNDIVREKLANSPNVEIISSGKTLLQADGVMSHHDAPDYFTLTDAGFRKVFEPVHELILQLFGENEEKNFWLTELMLQFNIAILHWYCALFSVCNAFVNIVLSKQAKKFINFFKTTYNYNCIFFVLYLKCMLVFGHDIYFVGGIAKNITVYIKLQCTLLLCNYKVRAKLVVILIRNSF